jgi:peptide/nickel transport system permease protein
VTLLPFEPERAGEHAAAELVAPAGAGRAMAAWLRFLCEHPSAAIGAAILVLAAVAAVLAPLIEPYSVTRASGSVFEHPSSRHWLGLDDAGFDVLSLLLQGARVSLVVAAAATLISSTVGGTVGLVSGYLGHGVDNVLMRITDYVLVVPVLPLMIVVGATWGASLGQVIVVIGLLQWAWTARIIRAQVRTLRSRTYIVRERAIGATRWRIMLRHVVPHVAPLLAATVVSSIAYAIFAETALAFLGVGDPTAVSWGTMLGHAFQSTAISSGAWWAVVPPGACVAVIILACAMVSRSLDDALNPLVRTAHLSPRSFRVEPLAKTR